MIYDINWHTLWRWVYRNDVWQYVKKYKYENGWNSNMCYITLPDVLSVKSWGGKMYLNNGLFD